MGRLEDDVVRALLDPGARRQVGDLHPVEGVAQARPAGHAVDVGGDVALGQGQKPLPVDRERSLDLAVHGEPEVLDLGAARLAAHGPELGDDSLTRRQARSAVVAHFGPGLAVDVIADQAVEPAAQCDHGRAGDRLLEEVAPALAAARPPASSGAGAFSSSSPPESYRPGSLRLAVNPGYAGLRLAGCVTRGRTPGSGHRWSEHFRGPPERQWSRRSRSAWARGPPAPWAWPGGSGACR